MFSLDVHAILMWIAIISLVILVSMTGMYLNRFFIHRAHRRALDELHRRATEAERVHTSMRPSAEQPVPETVKVRT